MYENGNIYEGNWENGIKHGQGKLTCKNGIYEGNWDRVSQMVKVN